MVIPGISIVCFAALSASAIALIAICAGALHRMICYLGFGVPLGCHIYNSMPSDFFVLFEGLHRAMREYI